MSKATVEIGMKCEHCDNEAVYEIEVDGKTVHVCEDCDEDYNICYICQSAISMYGCTRCSECINIED